MGIEDEDASGSCPVAGSSDSPTRRCPKKLEVYKEVLRRLQEAHHPEAQDPSFAVDLWNHFNRLPSRYAMDVNVERAEDVLLHKRLLHLARDPFNRPVFDVRLVQVLPAIDEISGCPVQPLSTRNGSIHPPPAFGSSQNLQALALEATEFEVNGSENSAQSHANCSRPTHEITFLTEDKPKMLSLVTSLVAEVGLNIQEAHAFNTVDGYILDIFVVNGWPFEEVEKLRNALQREVLKFKKNSAETHLSLKEQIGESVFQKTPNNSMDDWEIDPQFLEFESKVASGSYGDLYKGTYHSQDVAIKILKTERLNDELQKEFSQEVYIMRKVCHKNVVQFIGACTRPSNLCIVTEFMFGGSVYDILHKKKRTFKLPALLKVAIDVSRGMNYLHQNNIIHRDLKAANLLMDENEVVKVADFGVARVKAQTGVMTAETGTYRWMAPEVIQHKPYDHKVDVFSFGVVLWELLTGKVPYEYMTPIQAAVGVVQRGMRPCIPKHTHPKLADLIRRCWQQDPALRPDFSEIKQILQNISNEVANDVNDTPNDKPFGFFLRCYALTTEGCDTGEMNNHSVVCFILTIVLFPLVDNIPMFCRCLGLYLHFMFLSGSFVCSN